MKGEELPPMHKKNEHFLFQTKAVSFEKKKIQPIFAQKSF